MILCCLFVSAAAASSGQQPLEPLTKFRPSHVPGHLDAFACLLVPGQIHRKTVDGDCMPCSGALDSRPVCMRADSAKADCAQQHMCTTRKHSRCSLRCGILSANICTRLCFQDCTAAANPVGVSGREWCFVEAVLFLTQPPQQGALRSPSNNIRPLPDKLLIVWRVGARCKAQVASAGQLKWDYCAPKPNYAEARGWVRRPTGLRLRCCSSWTLQGSSWTVVRFASPLSPASGPDLKLNWHWCTSLESHSSTMGCLHMV